MPGKTVRVAGGVGMALLAIAFPWLTLHASGHWVPFVAQRVSKVYRVTASGKVLVSETSQLWLRNSQGSVYRRKLRIKAPGLSDKPASATAKLFDNTTGITYRIIYPTKSVLIMTKRGPAVPTTSVSFHKQLTKDRFIGRKIIDGIECEGWRLTWGITNAHPTGGDAGVEWVAPSLNYIPLESVINDDPYELVRRVTKIQPRTEPDSHFFQLPAAFSVSRVIRQWMPVAKR